MTVQREKSGADKQVPVRAPKKLIEVALPLDDINEACSKEKSIRHGHPSTIHLWWARRPLAAARAVIFAQMVNDPGYERSMDGGGQRGVNAIEALKERERLFDILRELVRWENTNNQNVLAMASAEIWRSWRETCELNKDHPQASEMFDPNRLPCFHDPFAGGGAIPLEAQRLGLESYGTDLNPVAVLINKALLEFPARFSGCRPVNPDSQSDVRLFEGGWFGAEGLADDVRYYGNWMRERAESRIGQLYPPANVTVEMTEGRPDLKSLVGAELPVISWVWVRTVRSPNPAFANIDVPLASTFVLSSKEGAEVYVDPVVGATGEYRFVVKMGTPPQKSQLGTSIGARAGFRCLLSGSTIDYAYIRTEGKAGRLGHRLMAVVAQSNGARVYLPPTREVESNALNVEAAWRPTSRLPEKHRSITAQLYGLDEHGKLFSPRQLVALNAFCDLVGEACVLAESHARMSANFSSLTDLEEYCRALAVYLAFELDYAATYWSVLATPAEGFIRSTFARQSLSMTWDYAEAPPFGNTSGNWCSGIGWIARALQLLPAKGKGVAFQCDAARQQVSMGKIVSTDPPYYDNIGYADLSDYFYPWLRRCLGSKFPELFSTLAVPKAEELVADAHRHAGRRNADSFFLTGMTEAMRAIASSAHPSFPVTIYYAFKQSKTGTSEGATDTSNTGWDVFLEAVIRAGFSITGTWPMRTERGVRAVGLRTNALASSIILVCRRRPVEALTISRRDFIRELREVLPQALKDMTNGEDHSPVAAVDLSQAMIGPGMAVYSKYSAVVEADGSPMKVKAALQLINRHLAGDDVDFDASSRFCLGWYEAHQWADGKFGEADVLARAKGTSVDTVATTGVLFSKGGIVRLLKHADYPTNWEPPTEGRPAVWEALHHLIRTQRTIGIGAAGRLLAFFPTLAEPIRQLAYRLYTLSERNNDAEEARAYNELITSWASIVAGAQAEGPKYEEPELGS